MRVLFYGTPAFALPTLQALRARHHVVAAVTQPDRPAGRGQRERVSPVKAMALEHGIPLLQPIRLRDAGWAERLAEHRADVAVVVALGQILPQAILDVPARGSINVHASLLPRMMAHAIGAEETAGELAGRLATLGAEVLLETLDRLDTLTPRPQDAGAATLAPRLRKEDGLLDWTEAAVGLAARVRGLNPWPGATTLVPGGRLAIGTGADLLEPVEVQPENRRPMAWEAYLRGARLAPGALLGATVPGA